MPSVQRITSTENSTLANFSRPHLEDRRIAAFIGDGATLLVRRALEATGNVDEALLAQAVPFFLTYYREHKLDFTYTYPGVVATLQRIRQAAPHVLMAVLTNKPVVVKRGQHIVEVKPQV